MRAQAPRPWPYSLSQALDPAAIFDWGQRPEELVFGPVGTFGQHDPNLSCPWEGNLTVPTLMTVPVGSSWLIFM